MDLEWLKPILMFLAGAGMQDVGLAIRRMRGADAGPFDQGQAGASEIMTSLGVPQPEKPQGPFEQFGPTPMQTLAMLELRRRMAAAQQGGAPMMPPMR